MSHHQTSPRAVYVHIPFCTNKCHYCDFNSYVLKGQPVAEYLDALEREMERTVRAVPPETIDTVFVGGGTPTVLTPDQMERFLGMVGAYFPIAAATEFSMEANPGTVEPEKLAAMKAGGVNRISFGAQSFDNGLLSAIGRIHDADDVYRSIELARKAGFANLSVDLMFGLPNQTLEQVEDSVKKALALDLPHYSLYALKVEENTLFHTLYRKDKLPLPDEDAELAMYKLIMRRFREAGYGQYEISNFARPDRACRHNVTYWRNESYYGLGAGAHGYVRGVRHVNAKGIREYIDAAGAGLPRIEEAAVPIEEAMEDFMMVGLRLLDGIDVRDYARQFSGAMPEDRFGDVIGRLIGRGLLIRTGEGYRLTDVGVLFGNEVFGAFLGA